MEINIIQMLFYEHSQLESIWPIGCVILMLHIIEQRCGLVLDMVCDSWEESGINGEKWRAMEMSGENKAPLLWRRKGDSSMVCILKILSN